MFILNVMLIFVTIRCPSFVRKRLFIFVFISITNIRQSKIFFVYQYEKINTYSIACKPMLSRFTYLIDVVKWQDRTQWVQLLSFVLIYVDGGNVFFIRGYFNSWCSVYYRTANLQSIPYLNSWFHCPNEIHDV